MLRMQPLLNRLMAIKVSLYGASGHGKVIADLLMAANYDVVAFFDDNPADDSLLSIPVYHSSRLNQIEVDGLILSVGNNKIRKKLADNLGEFFLKAIHPAAVLSPYHQIGEGSVVMAGVIVNPLVKIGKHCIINTGALIEHDCFIDDFVHISPRVALAGNVSIGEGTHVGIGASVIQGVKIGKWVTIGAGTVVIKDIPDYAVVVGTPGKIIKYNSKDE